MTVPVRPLRARAYRAWETRLPNHPGKRTLLRRLLPREPFAWPVANGALLAISPLEGLAFGETVGWSCFLTGVWEPGVERLLRDELRPGDVALDVGANLGYFAAVMAQAVGPSGLVVAFEPVPDTYERLCAAADLNGYVQLTPLPFALGAVEGKAEIGYDPRVAGSASLHSETGPAAVTVLIHSLDSLVEQGRVPLPALVKIDVEGHELDVLRGARETIAAARPTVVFELNGPLSRRAGWTLEDIAAELPEYRFTLLDERGERHLEPRHFDVGDDYVDVVARPSSA